MLSTKVGAPMKIRSTTAQILRKWADLIDPHVKPANEISYTIDARGTDPALTEKAVRRAMGYVHSTLTNQVQWQEWPTGER
jgi:hypothetical protein